MAGQWISIYALGSLLAAIPLTAATRSWRRRPLLLGAIVGFAIANLIAALTASFIVAMAARFVGGVSAGMLWALLAGYAVRMAPPILAGRAMAIAMAGTPLAPSIGIPAGTFIGNLAGWRLTFGLLSVIALLVVGWIIAKVPDFAGEAETQRPSLAQVFVVPGVDRQMAATIHLHRHRPVSCGGLYTCGDDRSTFGDIRGRTYPGTGFWRIGDALSDRISACCRSCGRCGPGDDRHGMEHRHFWRSRHGGHSRNRRSRRVVVGRYRPACRRRWISTVHRAPRWRRTHDVTKCDARIGPDCRLVQR